MSAEASRVRALTLRNWIASSVMISLVAALGPLASSAQVALAASHGAASAGSGGAHSCAIEGGKAYCWGYNAQGQLGIGSTVSSSMPLAVDISGVLAGKKLTQIATGDVHTCALDSTGSAYCWGDNDSGQLGDGSTSNSSVPQPVDNSGVLAGKVLTQITAGAGATCALDSAGAAYCWGDNSYGELGDGSEGPTTDSSVPVAVAADGALAGKTLTQITEGGGSFHVCALDSTGAAYCWGDNSYGEFGNGSNTGSSVPVSAADTGALADQALTQITASSNSTCGLDDSNAAYCWGWNEYGQLGDGTTSTSNIPMAVDTSGVLAGKTLTQVNLGGITACALDASGAAYCWGWNYYGELGDDSTTASIVPVAVDRSGVSAGKSLTEITVASVAITHAH